jgi:ABC-2 type transport system ATP-binding protein
VRRGSADVLELHGLPARVVGRLALEQGVELHALETSQDGLEHVFFSLTGVEGDE